MMKGKIVLVSFGVGRGRKDSKEHFELDLVSVVRLLKSGHCPELRTEAPDADSAVEDMDVEVDNDDSDSGAERESGPAVL